jgi:serine/threonine protein kinase
MSLSVLLVNSNTDVPVDIRALLESKISKITIDESSFSYHQGNENNQAQIEAKNVDLIITRDIGAIKPLSISGATVLHWNQLSDLSSKIDVFLQLRRRLSQYPLNLKDWTLTEVLHNSQDCIIYRGINANGISSAIKRFKFEPKHLSREMVLQFLQRVEKQCGIRSKGLVHFYDGGICNHSFYLVMEYLKYGTLRQNLNSCNKVLPEVHALEWFKEIAIALDCVHAAGLVHRDLKIDNVMLRGDGTLALTDYGVSKCILLDAGFIEEDELHCSPHYVSPEIITGESCTHASDIYSLGVIFYELLTGDKPYTCKQPHELMMQHVMAPVPEFLCSLKRYQPILDKMLAKCPTDRFSNAADVIRALEQLAKRYEKDTPHVLSGFQ